MGVDAKRRPLVQEQHTFGILQQMDGTVLSVILLLILLETYVLNVHNICCKGHTQLIKNMAFVE